MLKDYSEAESVTMDIPAMADKLYYYTAGYPFLVSKLCKLIAEEVLIKKEAEPQNWTLEDLETAMQLLLKEHNTNFETLIKNLEKIS